MAQKLSRYKVVITADAHPDLVVTYHTRIDPRKAFARAVKVANLIYPKDTVVHVDVQYDPLMRKVTNIMTGVEVEESEDTPYSCSVSSEAYWQN